MEFREIMKEFGARIGIADLSPDDANECRIKVDEMVISFLEDPASGVVVTWAEVCEPPPVGAEAIHRVLMEVMFMGRGTGGSTFSIEPESGKIFLHRVDPTVALDPDSFGTMVERFVNVLETWRKTIADFRPLAADKKSDGAAAGLPELRMDGFMQV